MTLLLFLAVVITCQCVFAQAPPSATLNLRVTTGRQPAAARIYITGADGRKYQAGGAVGYKRGVEVHSVIDGSAAIPLPPGAYTVRAEKGAEFRAAEATVNMASGEQREVKLEVPRFYDMNARGWYSGDLHIHRSSEEMPLLARAEDLNVSPVINRHVGGPRTERRPFPSTNLILVDPKHAVSHQNQEVERLGVGHGAVLLLNTAIPVSDDLTDLFPMDLNFCRQTKKQGGFVDAEKPIWKNVPVNIAFGVVDAIGIVNNHFHPNGMGLDAEKYGSMDRDKPVYQTIAGFAQWMIDLYYSFLNCGFRIPVSAGSASGVMPSWPGYERVYVHLSRSFSYEQWFRDLKGGRSIATNGPLLETYMDGKPPGTEMAWKEPTNVKLAIEAHSMRKLDRVEIVFNGAVLRTFSNLDSGEFKQTVDLRITEPGWLAVRCFEPVTSTIRYAHTSPFYFLSGGRLPIRPHEALRWADFIRSLAATTPPAAYPSRQAYEEARAVFGQAERIYRDLAQSAATDVR